MGAASSVGAKDVQPGGNAMGQLVQMTSGTTSDPMRLADTLPLAVGEVAVLCLTLQGMQSPIRLNTAATEGTMEVNAPNQGTADTGSPQEVGRQTTATPMMVVVGIAVTTMAIAMETTGVVEAGRVAGTMQEAVMAMRRGAVIIIRREVGEATEDMVMRVAMVVITVTEGTEARPMLQTVPEGMADTTMVDVGERIIEREVEVGRTLAASLLEHSILRAQFNPWFSHFINK